MNGQNFMNNNNNDNIKNLFSEFMDFYNSVNNQENVTKSETPKKSKKVKGMAKRPLDENEYNKIIEMLCTGFQYTKNGKKKTFRPKKNVALALTLEATCGFRISDVVALKVKDFMSDKIAIHEKKTNKLQYRRLNSNLRNLILNYTISHNLAPNDYLINCTERNIQKCLKIVVDELGLINIGTHSFRKFFSMKVYNETKDLLLLQTLLNHSSIAVTQKYLSIDQKKVDDISSSIDFTNTFTKFAQN